MNNLFLLLLLTLVVSCSKEAKVQSENFGSNSSTCINSEVFNLDLSTYESASLGVAYHHSNGLDYVFNQLANSTQFNSLVSQNQVTETDFDIIEELIEEKTFEYIQNVISVSYAIQFQQNIIDYNSLTNCFLPCNVDISTFPTSVQNYITQNNVLDLDIVNAQLEITTIQNMLENYITLNPNDNASKVLLDVFKDSYEYWSCVEENDIALISGHRPRISAATLLADASGAYSGASWGLFAGPLGAFMMGVNAAIIGSAVQLTTSSIVF